MASQERDDQRTVTESLPGYLPWEEDLEMVSKYLDRKVICCLRDKLSVCSVAPFPGSSFYMFFKCDMGMRPGSWIFDTLQFQEELHESHRQYMEEHPSLKAILADFMQALLIQKPDDVYQFARDFFAPFSPHSTSTSSYPSQRVNTKSWAHNNMMFLILECYISVCNCIAKKLAINFTYLNCP